MTLALPRVYEHDGVLVLRDDLLPGGTKRRVLSALMRSGREYVYASPAQGYAQQAIAYTAADLGAKATIFVADRASPHSSTAAAQAAGAEVHVVRPGYLAVVQARARDYADACFAELLPFGLHSEAMLDALAEVARRLPIEPSEVWSAAGSGTLSLALQRAWPQAEVHAVLVGMDHATIGRAILHRAPEPFAKPARILPPFASAAEYDAKVWRYVRERPGALFWNVGG